jgi:hypothetical protein
MYRTLQEAKSVFRGLTCGTLSEGELKSAKAVEHVLPAADAVCSDLIPRAKEIAPRNRFGYNGILGASPKRLAPFVLVKKYPE